MQTNNNGNQGRDSRDNQNDMNENTGNLGNSQYQQNMGSRGNSMDDEWSDSTQQGQEEGGQRMSGNDSDTRGMNSPGRTNSDQNTGWDSDSGSNRGDSRNMQSRTFNEDEETWEEEQRMGGSNANRGSEGNDWNQNDQMQRSPGRGSSEENRDASSGSFYADQEEEREKRRNNDGVRNNSGDDFDTDY